MQKLLQIGLERKYPAKALIFKAEDPANGFYYILKGQIRLYKLDSSGKEVEISRLSDKEFLGEIILFATDNFPVYAETISPVQILFFPKIQVLSAIEKDPEIAKFLLTLFAKKCYGLNQRLTMVTLQSIQQRLATYLLALSNNNNATIQLPIKKTDLAKYLMTTPETISRTLNEFKQNKIIKVQGQKVTISDCRLLQEYLS